MGAGHLRGFTTRVAHVLPVSDDGGSTAEIVRVLGGPAVGDIRSRCLRLADDRDAEARPCLEPTCGAVMRYRNPESFGGCCAVRQSPTLACTACVWPAGA